MKTFTSLCLILAASTSLAYANVSDVKETDSSFEAVSNSINKGYLPLSQGDKFYPDRAITRKDMALILEKIEQQQQRGLSDSEFDELSKLARSFKDRVITIHSKEQALLEKMETLSQENKELHKDVSVLTQQLEQSNADNGRWILVSLLLGVAGVLMPQQ